MKQEVGTFAALGIAGELSTGDGKVSMTLDFHSLLCVRSAFRVEQCCERLGVLLHDALVRAMDAGQRAVLFRPENEAVIQHAGSLQHGPTATDASKNRNAQPLASVLIYLA